MEPRPAITAAVEDTSAPSSAGAAASTGAASAGPSVLEATANNPKRKSMS